MRSVGRRTRASSSALTPARQRAMVEALRAKQENADFWMMQTPIVRQYDSAGENPPVVQLTNRGRLGTP